MSHNGEEETLDQLLAHICRLHHARAHALFQEIGLYRGQPPLLFALWEQDGLTHSELAGRLGITASTITRMVQRMERSGFVSRRPDPEDERISRVYVTDAGAEVRNSLRGIGTTMDREAFAGFREEERETLRGFLRRIRDNLKTAGAEDDRC